MSRKTRVIKVEGKGTLIKLPKKFIKWDKKWKSRKKFIIDYSSRHGIAVLTESPITREVHKERINELLEFKNNNKYNPESKRPAKKKENELAEVILKHISENKCFSADNTEGLYDSHGGKNDDLFEALDKVMATITKILSTGASASILLNILAGSLPDSKIESLSNTLASAFDPYTDTEKDEKISGIFEELYERHPYIEVSDIEHSKYLYLPDDSENKDHIPNYGSVLRFKADRNRVTVDEIPIGGIFMINGDVYLKQHNGSTIRSIINGRSLKDNLINAEFQLIKDHAKKDIPGVIKTLICSPLKIDQCTTFEKIDYSEYLNPEVKQTSCVFNDDGTLNEDKSVDIILSSVNGEKDFFHLDCDGVDDPRCKGTNCPVQMYPICKARQDEENFYNKNDVGDDMTDPGSEMCECYCDPDPGTECGTCCHGSGVCLNNPPDLENDSHQCNTHCGCAPELECNDCCGGTGDCDACRDAPGFYADGNKISNDLPKNECSCNNCSKEPLDE